MSTICIKLDPGMHIGLHLVFFGKTGVTRMECGDTQISCIAAKSLAEPPKACRPQEGLKSQALKHP
jgi:hypothetical protein